MRLPQLRRRQLPCCSSLVTSLWTILTFTTTTAQAQLIGCRELQCPTGPNGPFCHLGNHTSFALGTTAFSTAFNAAPLTWTVGLERLATSNRSIYGFERGFFLGVPPDLDFGNPELPFSACALFMDGPSRNLTFTGKNQDSAVGDCDDAMGKQCRRDVESQAKSLIKQIAKAGDSNSENCAALARAVRDSPPSSCNRIVQGGTWRSIRARALTESNAVTDIVLSTCSPTTGKKYTVSLIDTTHEFSGTSQSEVTGLLRAITPVITVFYPHANSSQASGSASAKVETEVHSSCMKVIQPSTEQSASGAPGLSISMLAVLLALFALLF